MSATCSARYSPEPPRSGPRSEASRSFYIVLLQMCNVDHATYGIYIVHGIKSSTVVLFYEFKKFLQSPCQQIA